MIDTFALLVSHALLVLVVLRLFKVPDPSLPPKKLPVKRYVPGQAAAPQKPVRPQPRA